MNTEVGAGTLNPATLPAGARSGAVAVGYVEPSVPPDDSRYGENPNRFQHHTQYQVILKPEPGNPQELYLGSLAALGIDVTATTTCGSSRTTGRRRRSAPGGWAGRSGWTGWRSPSSPTSSRPAASTWTRPRWRSPTASSGSSWRCRKSGTSRRSSTPPASATARCSARPSTRCRATTSTTPTSTRTGRCWSVYAAEAQRMIDAGLPVPAHSFVLKCSQAFNVLDSRGAVLHRRAGRRVRPDAPARR